MATKRSSKRSTIPTDEDGKPDIYVLTQEREMSFKEASEAAGINYATAHSLFWKQELQHEPELKVTGTPKQIAKAVVNLRDNEGLRWERIALRVNKTKNEVITIYAEATGQDPEDVKRRPAAEKPAKKKSAAKKSNSKKAAVVEDDDEEEEDIEEDEDEDEDEDEVEDDEDDEEEEDEEPAPPKRRGRAKK